MKLWNITTEGCIRTYIGHTNTVPAIGFSNDNKFVISGSDDYTSKLWNVTTG